MHREHLVLADGEQGMVMVITLNIFTCIWFTKSSRVCCTVGLYFLVGCTFFHLKGLGVSSGHPEGRDHLDELLPQKPHTPQLQEECQHGAVWQGRTGGKDSANFQEGLELLSLPCCLQLTRDLDGIMGSCSQPRHKAQPTS